MQGMARSVRGAGAPPGAVPNDERRQFRRAAWLLGGAIAVLLAIVLVAAVSSPPSKAERERARQEELANPRSIPLPDSGRAPQRPGDPGGWEQLALGGLLVVALAGGAVWLVHSSRKARRTRAPRRAPVRAAERH